MKTYKLKIKEKEFNTRIVDYNGERVIVKVNGQEYEVQITPEEKTIVRVSKVAPTPASAPLPAKPVRATATSPGTVVSPIPGLVLAVKVAIGDQVNKGDTVIILEAMKMESEIASTASGTVKKILVKEQQNIQEGDAIIEVG